MPKVDKLLIIEKEPVIRKILAQIVSRAGLEVEQTGDCKDAYSLLNKHDFEFLIISPELPEMKEYKFVNEVKGKYPNMTILVIGSSNKNNHLSDIVAAGADGLIIKPFRNNEISQIINLARSKRVNKAVKIS